MTAAEARTMAEAASQPDERKVAELLEFAYASIKGSAQLAEFTTVVPLDPRTREAEANAVVAKLKADGYKVEPAGGSLTYRVSW